MTPHELGLGDIVWWSLPDEINLTRDEWNNKYPDFNLGQEALGDPLRRALFTIPAPKGARRLVRPLKTRGHWGIVFETPMENDLVYHTEFTVKPHIGGALEIIKAEYGNQWISPLQEAYNKEYSAVTTTAAAEIILRAVRGSCLATQARKTGGVYFVPATFQDSLTKVEELVNDLGGRLYRFPVDNTKGQRENILHLITEDLKGSIELVRSQIDSRHKNDAIAESKAALDRVRFYRDALGMMADKANLIEAEIEGLIKAAMTKKEKNYTEGELVKC